MTGESYARLYCGYWVRHGSEQPYRKLPMLEGFTGLRRYLGNHMELRASTLRFLTPVKVGDMRLISLYGLYNCKISFGGL